MKKMSDALRVCLAFRRLLLAVLILPSLAATNAAASGDHWVATWGTAQQYYRPPAASVAKPVVPPVAGTASISPPPQPPKSGPARRFGIPEGVSEVNNQTIRMIARTSIGGSRIRVRLFNAIGASAVEIGAVHVGVRADGPAIAAGTDRALTFSGRTTATLYPGQLLVSDPVDLEIPPLTDLAVSVYFPEAVREVTSHRFGLRPTYISGQGNFAGSGEFQPVQTILQYCWLAGIDVLAPPEAATVVAFGDSITDGDQSTPDTNRMWPAVLAARLQANPATKHIGVVNAGISGNRILGGGSSGLVRLAHDALTQPGAKWIILLEGINDITSGAKTPQFDADDLIAAYTQVVERAHMQGMKVIGCTITPFGGSSVFTERGESIRAAANDWIRTTKVLDAVIDFDAATRDPANPTCFRKEADSPDMLHPGDAGYELMANAIDLSIFNRAEALP